MSPTMLLPVAVVVTLLALVGIPWLVIAWGRRVSRHAPQDAPLSWWLWRVGILVPLVPLGTYLMVGSFVHTWGWAATIWFFAASALRGLLTPRES